MRNIFHVVKLKWAQQMNNRIDFLSIQIRPFITLLPYVFFVKGYGTDLNIEYIVISFLLVLLCGNTLIMSVLGTNEDISNGKNLYILLAPINFVQLSIGNQLAWILYSLPSTVLSFILITLIFSLKWNIVWGGACASTLILLWLTISVGCIMSCTIIKRKNIRIVFYMFSLFMLFSGALYPVDTMPIALRLISLLNPLLYPLELCRFYILGNSSFGIAKLWIISILLLSISFFVVKSMKGEKLKKDILT